MRLTSILAGLGLLTASPALSEEKPAQPPKTETTYQIPYRLTGTKHVMVRVKLNDKGPFNFILDTGAPALIMTEAVAKKTGAELDKNGFGKFKLQVEGGLTVPEAKGLAHDMFQLKGMNSLGIAGAELHGVIGYNVLARFRITYDFTEDKLLWTSTPFDPPDFARIKADGDSQGGLEMMGNLMKVLAPLMGIKSNFEVKPRGFLGLEGEAGKACFVVLRVLPDSPAAKAGVRPGDSIQSINGRDVEKLAEVLDAVSKSAEGEKVKLRIQRKGETTDLTVELGKGL